MGYLDESFAYKWARKWVEGSILSYVNEKITLNMVIGRIKRVIKSYGISKEEILAIISEAQKSCHSIPNGEHKLQLLKGIVEKL